MIGDATPNSLTPLFPSPFDEPVLQASDLPTGGLGDCMRGDMLSKEQAQAITRAVHLLRPAWNEEGIYAALAQVKARDPFEVALAAIRAAKDDTARTPGVIPNGPHWNELPPTAPRPPRLSRDERRAITCADCGREGGCAPPAHKFLPLDQATQHRTPPPHGYRTDIQPTITFEHQGSA